MAKRVFTDTWIKNLRPHDVRRDFTEAGRPGFMLRVWPGAEKTFVVRYRSLTRKNTKGTPVAEILTLGRWPTMSLADAHDEHSAARKQLSRGLDPIEERKSVARAKDAAQRQAAHKSGTVGKLFDEWMQRYVERERKRPEQVRQAFEANVLPKWSTRPARDITKRDVVELLDRIVDRGKPVMANRTFNMLKQCFEFGVARDLIDASPCVGVEKPGGTEHARERKLTADEIKTFWAALDREDDEIEMSRPVRLGLRLILVTAQRPGEVAGAAWSEFDTAGKNATWTIPADRSKNGRAHEVPLSGLALEIIADLRQHAGERPSLLPSWQSKLKRDEPLSIRALSRALRNNHDDESGKLFGLAPFTPHDLRRTAASMMTSLGIPRLHVSKVLNHTDQDITGAVYDRYDYGPDKRKALDIWATELRAIVTGEQRKVVPIAGKRRRRA